MDPVPRAWKNSDFFIPPVCLENTCSRSKIKTREPYISAFCVDSPLVWEQFPRLRYGKQDRTSGVLGYFAIIYFALKLILYLKWYLCFLLRSVNGVAKCIASKYSPCHFKVIFTKTVRLQWISKRQIFEPRIFLFFWEMTKENVMFGNLFLKCSRRLPLTSLQKKSVYDKFFNFFETSKGVL